MFGRAGTCVAALEAVNAFSRRAGSIIVSEACGIRAGGRGGGGRGRESRAGGVVDVELCWTGNVAVDATRITGSFIGIISFLLAARPPVRPAFAFAFASAPMCQYYQLLAHARSARTGAVLASYGQRLLAVDSFACLAPLFWAFNHIEALKSSESWCARSHSSM